MFEISLYMYLRHLTSTLQHKSTQLATDTSNQLETLSCYLATDAVAKSFMSCLASKVHSFLLFPPSLSSFSSCLCLFMKQTHIDLNTLVFLSQVATFSANANTSRVNSICIFLLSIKLLNLLCVPSEHTVKLSYLYVLLCMFIVQKTKQNNKLCI